MSASASDVCSRLLSGLEEDILDYIVSMIDSREGDTSDIQESIISFLVGSEYCDSNEIAEKKCMDIFQELGISYGTVSANEPIDSSTPSLLEKPQSLADKNAPLPEPPKKGRSSNYNTPIATLVPATFEPKAVKQRNKQRKVPKAEAELEAEIEEAKLLAAKSRSEQGAYNGVIEANNFTLPNPGGGAPLLENASFNLVRGHRYGLIGRNGKGKSTLLKAIAARRVGSIPSNVTIHYVTQDVEITESTRDLTPVQCVLTADIEREYLMKESALLEKAAAAETLDSVGQKRLVDVIEQLQLIEADSAERRAEDLLVNLGFSEELRARPLKELSGGWRVRTMLAAAIFAKPDMLLLDEVSMHCFAFCMHCACSK